MGKYTILITNLLAMICLVIAIIYVDMIVPMFLFLILLWRIQKDYDEIEKLKDKYKNGKY